MSNKININNTLKPFNKTLEIEGDKSLSIRWALLASQANGKSISKNLLKSEDVLNTLNSLKKLGVKIRLSKIPVKYMEWELMVLNTKKILHLTLETQELCRLIMGLLIHSKIR